jgi:radical SAM superfamily enzyme YgiQ (UPF0313 family)
VIRKQRLSLKSQTRNLMPAVADPMSPASTRVLLVSANTEAEPHPVYPLALDMLRQALTRRGIEAAIWDRSCPQQSLADVLSGFRPHLVGVSIRNVDNNDGVRPRYYLPEIFDLIADIKRLTPAPVVLGGSGYSLFPLEILQRSCAEWGLAGPGEQALADLAAHVAARESPDRVPGLLARNGVRNPPDRPTTLSGAISRDAALARSYWERGGSINVQVKRGCPHRCIYCTYPGLEGPEVCERPAAAAADEVEALHRDAGVDSFFVVDSVFNLDSAAPRAFADELVRRRLPVHWTAFFMPRGLTVPDVTAWRASGLEGVEFGVDTLAPELLQSWGKPFTVRDVESSARLCADLDVPYVMYLLFGGPGETIETVRQTLERACALPRAVVYAFQGLRVYPGTGLHEVALADGVVAPGQDLMDPVFYFSPHLSREALDAELAPLASKRNWLIAGAGMEQAKRLSAVIRRGGGKGSLWHLLRPRT